MYFDENDLLTLAKDKLKDDLGNDKELATQPNQIVYQSPFADFSKNLLNFSAKINGKIFWKINSDALKREIAGRNRSEVERIFNSHQEIVQAEVSLWPFWVKSVPANLDKIKISLKLD